MSHVGALVPIVALRFQLQTTHMDKWKLLERQFHSLCQASFAHTMCLPANMDAIDWGKATIAREPNNEHNPYTVAVLENAGVAADGSGCATSLCTVTKAQGLHL